jgi:hypothetical protein
MEWDSWCFTLLTALSLVHDIPSARPCSLRISSSPPPKLRINYPKLRSSAHSFALKLSSTIRTLFLKTQISAHTSVQDFHTYSCNFDVHVTVHHKISSGNEPARCNTYDVYSVFFRSTWFGHQYAQHQEYNIVDYRTQCPALVLPPEVEWSWAASCEHCRAVVVGLLAVLFDSNQLPHSAHS